MEAARSFKRALVAVDGSEVGGDVLRRALELAQALGCSVTAVMAIQTRMAGYRAGYFSFVDRHILDELRQFAGQALDGARQAAAEFSVPFETQLLEGDDEIYVQLANHLGATPDVAFLAIGSCGHNVRDRQILGSTTQRLIQEVSRRELKTPLLVVP